MINNKQNTFEQIIGLQKSDFKVALKTVLFEDPRCSDECDVTTVGQTFGKLLTGHSFVPQQVMQRKDHCLIEQVQDWNEAKL